MSWAQVPRAQVVLGFSDSAEFINATTAGAAAATGLANWTARLDNGMTRAKVVEGFSQSEEFTNSTKDALAAWMRAQGTDDTLDGGAGNDVLAGGAFADVFVLGVNAGRDTIMDLDAWDMLDLSALNYASGGAARGDFVQQGADVLFDNGAGTSAILRDTDLGMLTDDLILV